MQWIDKFSEIFDEVFGVIACATAIWLIVHLVNQCRQTLRKKGPIFWISLSLLAMIPMILVATLAMLWLAIEFK